MDLKDKEDSIKEHDEIIQMIDEIRGFEDIHIDFEPEIKKERIEIFEIENDISEENKVDIDKKDKQNFLKKIKFNIHPDRETIKKELKPNVFNIGFNDNGELVNLDLKKKKVIEKTDKKLSLDKFKNLIKRNKNKSDVPTSESDNEKGSKFSKIKDKLGKIGKLKKIIPSRSKNEEKAQDGSE